MRFTAYPKYKPSGVEWLGDVPEHWDVKRGRFCMDVNPSSRRIRTLQPDDEVSFVPMEAVGEYGGLELGQTRAIADVGSGYTEFEDGDVVVAKITPCFENGKGALATGLVNGAAFGTTELHVLRSAPILERRFLFYFSISQLFRSAGEGEMYGAGGQKRVPPEFCENVRLPLPPIDDQRAIADFLDRETAKIDALVAKKRTLIERLKEKRTALISRTVTRGLPPDAARAAGLDPHPKLKPSGIDWLGEVPEHWEVKRLKQLLLPRKGAIKTGPFGSQLHSSEMLDGDVKVFNQRTVIDRDISSGENYVSFNKFAELAAFEVFPGDLLVTTRGTIGRCMVVPADAEQGVLHPCLMRIQTNPRRVETRFLELLIEESGRVLEQLRVVSNATTIDVIYSESLKEVWIPVPPPTEQQKISEFLETQMAKIDGMVAKVETAIERLQEYRSALITAAVTGKIDVRGAAA